MAFAFVLRDSCTRSHARARRRASAFDGRRTIWALRAMSSDISAFVAFALVLRNSCAGGRARAGE
eukprot:13978674-Alexandrium_andersonii.AAC.1